MDLLRRAVGGRAAGSPSLVSRVVPRHGAGGRALPAKQNALPSGRVAAEGQRAPQFSPYLVGLDFDSTLTVPEMMSFLSLSSSLFRSAGTAESRSWNGARATPPFARVPMYGEASNLPSLSSLMTVSTAVDMVFWTEERITDL